MLATIEDVKNIAEKKNVNIENYSDSDLTQMLADEQEYLEIETGRIFDVQTKVDERFNHKGVVYFTRYWPIISIELLTITNTPIEPSNWRLWKERGAVLFNTDFVRHQPGFRESYDFHIEYTAGYDPTLLTAKNLCLDLIIARIKYNLLPYDGLISQLKEDTTSINIDTTRNALFSIDERIRKLKNVRIKQI